MKPYIVLRNKKEIKVKKLSFFRTEDSFFAEFCINSKYLKYFNTIETQILSLYFKGFFTKSEKINFDTETVPSYLVNNNTLFITLNLEEI